MNRLSAEDELLPFRRASAALLVGMLGFASLPLAANDEAAHGGEAAVANPDAEVPTGTVEIDGYVLFRVRGLTAFPAEERAAAIATRIKAFADDASVPTGAVSVV